MHPEHETLGQRLYAAESEIKELREIIDDNRARADSRRAALAKRIGELDSRVYSLECGAAMHHPEPDDEPEPIVLTEINT